MKMIQFFQEGKPVAMITISDPTLARELFRFFVENLRPGFFCILSGEDETEAAAPSGLVFTPEEYRSLMGGVG